MSSFVIFSGGTACNHIARAFHSDPTNDVCYVLGISDNGGSSSELLRVLGGPSIGDLRSRLTRLIDFVEDGQLPPERTAIRDLLSYRLPADAPEQDIKDEWTLIVEGRHPLWQPIPNEKKEAIRGFLTSFHCEILKRAHKRFDFRNGSIGNFFLTGARLFFGSLEAALFLFAAITGISQRALVVPVINTNHTATIAAELQNGETLSGQNEISHPAPVQPGFAGRRPPTPGCRWTLPNPIDAFSHLAIDDQDDDNDSTQTNRNLIFSKHENTKLASPIQRIYYINQYGQEVFPVPNPKVISHLSSKRTLIYSIGSLYTSIVPNLILRNVGNTIAHSSSLVHKILLLNGSNDRETCDFTAVDFIDTIAAALNQSRKIDARRAFYQTINEPLPVDSNGLLLAPHRPALSMSSCSSASSSMTTNTTYQTTEASSISLSSSHPWAHGSMPGTPTHHYPPFPDHSFVSSPPSAFITHLIYLDNGQIPVDLQTIENYGIRCIQIPGTLSPEGEPIYDEAILSQTLSKITSS
ncbi:hypothetical protein BCR43DRAFT_486662 [Syncephalastrum racemosum]|uniref:Uncharacterized protein n=1 Tax=Syncephalastrum racemosum TaxID=13706 RepID=A0A1X2HPN7_SYNRA|nr:hypothetical protein BCR43DRAFT_486662 [Syncephalastrum racemosum]